MFSWLMFGTIGLAPLLWGLSASFFLHWDVFDWKYSSLFCNIIVDISLYRFLFDNYRQLALSYPKYVELKFECTLYLYKQQSDSVDSFLWANRLCCFSFPVPIFLSLSSFPTPLISSYSFLSFHFSLNLSLAPSLPLALNATFPPYSCEDATNNTIDQDDGIDTKMFYTQFGTAQVRQCDR